MSVGRVSTDGDRATGSLGLALEGRVEDLVLRHHRAPVQGQRPPAATPGWCAGRPTIVEPSLKDGERLVESTVAAEARPDPRRPGRAARHLATGRCASGSTRPGCPPPRPLASARRIAAAGGRRREGVRRAGPRRGPTGVRAGDRLPPAGRTGRGPRRPRGHQGWRRRLRRACRSRRPRSSPPRSSAPSARRPPRSSRRARAGSSPVTTSGSPACRRGTTSSCAGTRGATVVAVPDDQDRAGPCSPPTPWTARRCAPPSTRRRRPPPSRRSPVSARPAPSSPSGPRPATSSPWRADRARRATTPRPTAATRPARPSRSSARSRCCAPASPRSRACRAPRRPWWTARGSRTTATTRPRASGEITFEDALANSCNTAFISERGKLGPHVAGRRGGRARLRRRPRHRLPDLLRPGGHSRQRDPDGGRHDRPGHRARLADGDGHGGRLGAQGLGRAAAAAARPRGRGSRRRRSRSPPRRPGAAHDDARGRRAGQRRPPCATCPAVP